MTTAFVNDKILKYFDVFGANGDIKKATAEFAQGQIKPLAAEMDEKDKWPDKLWPNLGSHNFLGVTIPEQYGGIGGGYITECIVSEELSRASGAAGLSTIAHSNLCMGQLNRVGTEFQKGLMLPGLAMGKFVGALAMSEPEAGSDVMSMRTTATKTAGGWIINGVKQWITNGRIADVLIVYAKTPTPEDPKAMTTFIVYKPGAMSHYKSSRKEDKEGMRGSETAQLEFNDCFIPENMVLGEPYKGAHVLKSGLNYERLVLAAGALGIAQAALDDTIKYTSERKQFGQPLVAKDAVATDLARMQARVASVRNYIYYAARWADNSKDFPHVMAAVAFFEASDMAREVTMDCMRLFGGNGYSREYPLGRYHRDALLYEVGGGAREVRLDIIASTLFKRARNETFNQAATETKTGDIMEQAHIFAFETAQRLLEQYKNRDGGVPQHIAHELATAVSRLYAAMALRETARSVEEDYLLDAYSDVEREAAVRQTLEFCRKYARPEFGTSRFMRMNNIERSFETYPETLALSHIVDHTLPAAKQKPAASLEPRPA